VSVAQLDLGVTEVSKIDSTWDKSDSKSTWICLNLNLNFTLPLSQFIANFMFTKSEIYVTWQKGSV